MARGELTILASEVKDSEYFRIPKTDISYRRVRFELQAVDPEDGAIFGFNDILNNVERIMADLPVIVIRR